MSRSRLTIGILLAAVTVWAGAGGLELEFTGSGAAGNVTVCDSVLTWTGAAQVTFWMESAAGFTGQVVLVGRASSRGPARLEVRGDGVSLGEFDLPAERWTSAAAPWRAGPGIHRLDLLCGEGVGGAVTVEVRSVLLVGPADGEVRQLRAEDTTLSERFLFQQQQRLVDAIDAARAGWLTVTVYRATQPATGIPVRVRMISPGVRLGFYLGESGDAGNLEERLRCLAVTGLFSSVMSPGVLSWADCEPAPKEYHFAAVDEFLSLARALEFRSLAGPAVSQCREDLPSWATDLPESELREVVLRWARVAAAHVRGSCDALEIMGETGRCNWLDERLGLNLLRQMAYEAGMVSRGTRRLVGINMVHTESEAEAFLQTVLSYMESGARLDGLCLGLACSVEREDATAQRILAVVRQAEIPILVAPLRFLGKMDESGLQRTLNCLLLLLAEPRVEGVLMEAKMLRVNGEECFPSELAQRLELLIRHRLYRERIAATDSAGSARFRLLPGCWEVSAGMGPAHVTTQVEIQAGGAGIRLEIPAVEAESPAEAVLPEAGIGSAPPAAAADSGDSANQE